ncbi:MAG TPA: ATP12 family protein [Acetobacteraceae bacterium]|nr:ATP12 family protein [Acetobacteraceae bacterium]
MKRFWKTADTAETEPGAWSVVLDSRPVRVPGGAPLRLDRHELAAAIAAEWQRAGGDLGGEMTYRDVPLTRLAGTAQERIAPDPEPVVLELTRYGESDLLCYRAACPEALVERQRAAWQPWLDWAAEKLGARLRVTEGVMHVAQDPAALAALAQAVALQDPLGLAGLGVLVPALGSLVLGLAVASFELSPEDAYARASVDEAFQVELWGEDADAAARRRQIREEVLLAGSFLRLARGTPV